MNSFKKVHKERHNMLKTLFVAFLVMLIIFGVTSLINEGYKAFNKQDIPTIQSNGASIYVNKDYQDENGSSIGTNDRPYKSLTAAMSQAEDGDEILIQADHNITSQFNVAKDLTIKTADIDIDGNPISDQVTLLRSGTNDSIFKVNAGVTLTLENIIIDGGQSESSTGSNPIVSLEGTQTNEANLVLNNGALLTKGKRPSSQSGGAILFSYGSLVMNEGSEISGNFGNRAAFTRVNNTKAEFTMNGGKIVNNIPSGTSQVILNIGHYESFTVKGNSEIHSNSVNGKEYNVEWGQDGETPLTIASDFTGKIRVDDADAETKATNKTPLNIELLADEETGKLAVDEYGRIGGPEGWIRPSHTDSIQAILLENGDIVWSKFKTLYVNTSFTGTVTGEYYAPYKSLSTAMSAAQAGDVILVQADLSITSQHTISKDLTIKTADIDMV